MKVYKLETVQTLPISIEEAWDFFSSPKNLQEITPPSLDFKILEDIGNTKMYPGQIINYIVKPFPMIPMRWTTEISHVKDLEYFVDEQRFGPYSFWHHKHFFKSVPGGVEMIDIVHYALPLGILGQFAHMLFVKAQLKHIFDYRWKILDKKFHK